MVFVQGGGAIFLLRGLGEDDPARPGWFLSFLGAKQSLVLAEG